MSSLLNRSQYYNRVMKLYKFKHRSFGNSQALAAWYEPQLMRQNYCCYYCETSVGTLQRLIENGLLKTRATRGGGHRGSHLEIDKQGSVYSPETCVLACYYCNNDRS